MLAEPKVHRLLERLSIYLTSLYSWITICFSVTHLQSVHGLLRALALENKIVYTVWS